MKIRFSSQHIRIRISPKDAEMLSIGEPLILKYHFGSALEFRLEMVNEIDCTLVQQEHQIVFGLNDVQVLQWLNTQEEKLTWTMNDQVISLEKDYPCEHRPGDGQQTFERPR
jgi:hypothetical protein